MKVMIRVIVILHLLYFILCNLAAMKLAVGKKKEPKERGLYVARYLNSSPVNLPSTQSTKKAEKRTEQETFRLTEVLFADDVALW